MTTTLSVIALVTHLKQSTQTVFGEAKYRDNVSNEYPVFGFKQFIKSQHPHNEKFGEGDLVSFGGRFTLDDKKLMVSIFIIYYAYYNVL